MIDIKSHKIKTTNQIIMKFSLSLITTLVISSSANANDCFRNCLSTSVDRFNFDKCLSKCPQGKSSNKSKDVKGSSLRGPSTEHRNLLSNQCGEIYSDCSSNTDCCGQLVCHDFGFAGASLPLCTDDVPSFSLGGFPLDGNDNNIIITGPQDNNQCVGLYDDCSGSTDCCVGTSCHDFGFAGSPILLCTDYVPGQCGQVDTVCSSDTDCCGDMVCRDFGMPGLFVDLRCSNDIPSDPSESEDDDYPEKTLAIDDDNYLQTPQPTPTPTSTPNPPTTSPSSEGGTSSNQESDSVQDDDQCAGTNSFCWNSDYCCGDLICHDFGVPGIYSDFLCTDEVPSFNDDIMFPNQDDSQCRGIYSDCSSNIDCCGDMVCHDFGFAGVPTLLCTNEAPSNSFDNDDSIIIPPQQDSQCVGDFGDCSSDADCCGTMTCHDFGFPGVVLLWCTNDANSFPYYDDDDPNHLVDDQFASKNLFD